MKQGVEYGTSTVLKSTVFHLGREKFFVCPVHDYPVGEGDSRSMTPLEVVLQVAGDTETDSPETRVSQVRDRRVADRSPG